MGGGAGPGSGGGGVTPAVGPPAANAGPQGDGWGRWAGPAAAERAVGGGGRRVRLQGFSC